MVKPSPLIEMLERLLRDQVAAQSSPSPSMVDGWSTEDALVNLATACLRLSQENRRLGETREALERALAAELYTVRRVEFERDAALALSRRRLAYVLRLRRHVRERFGARHLPLA